MDLLVGAGRTFLDILNEPCLQQAGNSYTCGIPSSDASLQDLTFPLPMSLDSASQLWPLGFRVRLPCWAKLIESSREKPHDFDKDDALLLGVRMRNESRLFRWCSIRSLRFLLHYNNCLPLTHPRIARSWSRSHHLGVWQAAIVSVSIAHLALPSQKLGRSSLQFTRTYPWRRHGFESPNTLPEAAQEMEAIAISVN